MTDLADASTHFGQCACGTPLTDDWSDCEHCGAGVALDDGVAPTTDDRPLLIDLTPIDEPDLSSFLRHDEPEPGWAPPPRVRLVTHLLAALVLAITVLLLVLDQATL